MTTFREAGGRSGYPSPMATQRSRPTPPTGDLDATEMVAWGGLLRTHAALLLSRSDDGALRMNELADGALLSLSGLSRLVDRLVNLGLVERAQCPTDRRGAFAVITPTGRDRFAAARPVHLDAVRRQFIDRLSPDAVSALAAAWTTLGASGCGEPEGD